MMKRLLRNASLVACLAAAVSWLGCAGGPTRQSTGQYIDSTAITAKAKAALIDDPMVKGFDVNVDTYKDVVQLNGFVETEAQKNRAEEIIWGIEGVRGVQNNLTVRSQIKPAEGDTTPTVDESVNETLPPPVERED